MTRSFSKNTSFGQIKLTALCIAIALGWMVNGGPSAAEETHHAAAQAPILALAHIC